MANSKAQKKDNVVNIEEKRDIAPITNVEFSEHTRREYVCYPEPGTTIEDVTKLTYWTYVADKFEPLNTWLDVISQDGTWVARLLVVACERNWAKLQIIYYHEIEGGDVISPSEQYDINFIPAHRWRIVRKSDHEVMQKGFSAKSEAVSWLDDYIRTTESR